MKTQNQNIEVTFEATSFFSANDKKCIAANIDAIIAGGKMSLTHGNTLLNVEAVGDGEYSVAKAVDKGNNYTYKCFFAVKTV